MASTMKNDMIKKNNQKIRKKAKRNENAKNSLLKTAWFLKFMNLCKSFVCIKMFVKHRYGRTKNF